MKFRKRTFLLGIGIGLAVLSLVALVKMLMVPPGMVTFGGMSKIKILARKFYERYGRPPDSLEEVQQFSMTLVPEVAGEGQWIKDEWGNRLIYDVDPNGSVRLKSLGRDNRPGGKGKNEDITLHFRLRTNE